MTSESDPSAIPEDPPPTPAETASGSDSATGMVSLGALILIGTYLVFGFILNDYWVSWLAMLLAISAVLLVRVNTPFIEALAPVPVLLKVIGYLLAIIGLLAFVEDLRFPGGTWNKFPDVIGALAAYAGYGTAFLGARSIKV